MKMSNTVYEILKYVAQIVLPALETFWLTLGAIWGFPCYEAVGATIAAVDVLLGALLKLSSDKYYLNTLEKAGEKKDDGES